VEPIIGTEAIASGALTRGQLRWNYLAAHPNVYLPKGQKRTLLTDAQAAWLWTGRRGIVAGRAAAGLHGVHGIGDSIPIDLIAQHTRKRPGIVVREERIDDDEVQTLGPLPMTTPARTALDLGRHQPRDVAIRHLDELAAATGLGYADVAELLDRYRGARGIQNARGALSLMDGGTRSPRETRLRLMLIDGGLPSPRTSIVLRDGFDTAVIGMGWDGPKVGVSIVDDRPEGYLAIRETERSDVVQRLGWIEILVVDLTRRSSTLQRVRDALRRRGVRV
jgi:hypothetical protein